MNRNLREIQLLETVIQQLGEINLLFYQTPELYPHLQLYNSSVNNLTGMMKTLMEQGRTEPYLDLYLDIHNEEPTLTREQIQQSVETKVYDLSFNESSCPITMENFVVGEDILQIKRCKHIFKNQPLSRWFQNNSTCPVCRQNILEPIDANSILRNSIQRILDNFVSHSMWGDIEEVD